MYELKIFENPEFGKMRTTAIDGEPWLVGKDVAKALGYSNPRDALAKHVDSEDKGVSQITTSSGAQDMTIINESGVYSLIFSSKLPKAKEFKHWVTSEVLPSIRKTGGYAKPDAVHVVAKPQPEVSLIGLARVATAARRAVLDMGGSRWEAGAEVLSILNYCGLPVPDFVPPPKNNYLSLRFEDFFI